MFDVGLSDDEFVYMIRQKDETAFYYLTKKYTKSIEIFINTFLKSNILYGFDRNDIKQELMMVFFDCIYHYCEEKGILYQLVKICCMNKLTSLGRSVSTYRNRALNTAFSADQVIDESEELSFIDNFEANYLLSDPKEVYKVKEMVDLIKSNHQEIFENLDAQIFLMRNEGLSYAQIAQKLNISTKLVDNRLRNIKRRLKKFLLE